MSKKKDDWREELEKLQRSHNEEDRIDETPPSNGRLNGYLRHHGRHASLPPPDWREELAELEPPPERKVNQPHPGWEEELAELGPPPEKKLNQPPPNWREDLAAEPPRPRKGNKVTEYGLKWQEKHGNESALIPADITIIRRLAAEMKPGEEKDVSLYLNPPQSLRNHKHGSNHPEGAEPTDLDVYNEAADGYQAFAKRMTEKKVLAPEEITFERTDDLSALTVKSEALKKLVSLADKYRRGAQFGLNIS